MNLRDSWTDLVVENVHLASGDLKEIKQRQVRKVFFFSPSLVKPTINAIVSVCLH